MSRACWAFRQSRQRPSGSVFSGVFRWRLSLHLAGFGGLPLLLAAISTPEEGGGEMPEAFERERRKRGRRVRTVTKGPGKGKLIAVGGEHPVMGDFPEGTTKASSRASGKRGGRRARGPCRWGGH